VTPQDGTRQRQQNDLVFSALIHAIGMEIDRRRSMRRSKFDFMSRVVVSDYGFDNNQFAGMFEIDIGFALTVGQIAAVVFA
jgi:hypothetical protein